MQYYIGIDFGNSHIKAGIVDENGILINKESIKTRPDRKPNDIVRDIAFLAQNAADNSKVPLNNIKAAGLSIDAIPIKNKGTIINSQISSFNNYPIKNDIQRILKLPVFIEKSANCLALAEHFAGVSKETKNSVAIILGPNISSGMIINNKVFEVANHAAGDVSHMVIKIDGELCNCGRRGCFNAYASEKALIEKALIEARNNPIAPLANLFIKNDNKISIPLILQAINSGDSVTQFVFDKYIHYLSEGICNVINFISPQVIVLSGELSLGGDFVLDRIKMAVYENSNINKSSIKTDIKWSSSGEDALLIGAALCSKLNCQTL